MGLIKISCDHILEFKKNMLKQSNTMNEIYQNISYVEESLDSEVLSQKNIQFKLNKLQKKADHLQESFQELADILDYTIEQFIHVDQEVSLQATKIRKD